MSVINKMLKDLDERKLDETEAQSQHNQANFIAQQKTPINWMLLVMLLILIALAFIGWQLTESKHTSVVDNNGVNSATHKEPAGSNELTNSKDSNSGSASTKTVFNNPKLASDKVDLNSSISENVQESLHSAVVSDSTQQPSLGNMTNSYPQDNDRTKSEIVNDRSHLATTSDTPVKPLINADSSLPGDANDALPIAQVARVETHNSFNAADVQQATRLPNETVEHEPHDVSETTPQLVIERSNAKLTPEQQVNKLMAKAENSFEKGYITEGISQLEQVLTISDMYVEARNMLAGAWYGRGEVNRAISILNNGLQRNPANESWRLTAAKIFFKENNPAGALSYLDVELTSVSKEFLTMKGSLGRQLQQFDKSESAYSKLAEMEPTVGNWWLGLAIAQDSLGKHQQALISYQNLVRFGGVSADSIAFAKQRITELKG